MGIYYEIHDKRHKPNLEPLTYGPYRTRADAEEELTDILREHPAMKRENYVIVERELEYQK